MSKTLLLHKNNKYDNFSLKLGISKISHTKWIIHWFLFSRGIKLESIVLLNSLLLQFKEINRKMLILLIGFKMELFWPSKQSGAKLILGLYLVYFLMTDLCQLKLPKNHYGICNKQLGPNTFSFKIDIFFLSQFDNNIGLQFHIKRSMGNV